MDKLFRTTLLTSTIAALLLLAWVLTKVGQQQVCINSPIVEFVDIGTSSVFETLQACSYLSPPSVPLKFKPYSRRVNEATATIGGVLHTINMPLNIAPLRIVVKLDKPFLLQVSRNQIQIGIDMFESEGQLERALLESILIQNANGGFERSHLAREIVADYIIMLTTGSLDLHDPSTNRSTYGFLKYDRNWLKGFNNLSSLCKTAWKAEHMFELCASNEILSVEKDISVWSLRPLLSSAFEYEGDELSISDKKRLLQNIFKQGRYVSWQSLPSDSFNNISSALNAAKIWSEFLGLKGKLISKISEQISNPDLLVVSPKGDDTFEMLVLKQFTLLNSSVFNKVLDEVSFYPMGPKFKLGDIKMRPRHLIVRSAQPLSVGRLEEFESQDQRVLQILDLDPNVNVVSYVKDGIKGWISSNLKTSFRAYHLPSLKLASQWGLSQDLLFDNRNPSARLSPMFKNLFGLKSPQFIVKANVNYIPGPLSVIEWYR